MKKFICLVFLLMLSNVVGADTYVNGYYRSNGTYVQPHYRTSPNYTKYDNYSTKGNYNPYTGSQGTVNPLNTYKSTRSQYTGTSSKRYLGY